MVKCSEYKFNVYSIIITMSLKHDTSKPLHIPSSWSSVIIGTVYSCIFPQIKIKIKNGIYFVCVCMCVMSS